MIPILYTHIWFGPWLGTALSDGIFLSLHVNWAIVSLLFLFHVRVNEKRQRRTWKLSTVSLFVLFFFVLVFFLFFCF